ncbi:MAG: SDR family oxidoreductase [Myxococcota bacterium]
MQGAAVDEPSKRTALITGASAGLGVEFARQLAAQGFDVFLVARRAEKLEAVAEELRERFGVAAHTFGADLSEPGAPQRIAEAVERAGVQVDYLVNNAGAAGPELLAERDWGVQREFLELMMISVAHLCHLFIPPMRKRGYGRVINVASVAGRIPRSGDTTYGPSKAYLIALSEGLAMTLGGSGVHVSALCPGYTHTDFHATAGMLDKKASLPKFLWYDADVVVREGLLACERNKPVYVSGRLYRWLDPLFQSVLTRRFLRVPRRR